MQLSLLSCLLRAVQGKHRCDQYSNLNHCSVSSVGKTYFKAHFCLIFSICYFCSYVKQGSNFIRVLQPFPNYVLELSFCICITARAKFQVVRNHMQHKHTGLFWGPISDAAFIHSVKCCTKIREQLNTCAVILPITSFIIISRLT